MASKRKQGTLAKVGQTVTDAAQTAISAADHYVLEPVGSFLGLTGQDARSRKRPAGKKTQPASASRPAKKKTLRKSAARPATRAAKRPTTRTAKRPVKAKPSSKARGSATARQPATAKRK